MVATFLVLGSCLAFAWKIELLGANSCLAFATKMHEGEILNASL